MDGAMSIWGVWGTSETGHDKRLAAIRGRLLAGGAMCALCLAPVVSASDAHSQTVQVQGADISASRQFDIPAQPLITALSQFGRQSGLQVAFPAETTQGTRSNAVVGSFTPEQALTQLLQGTGVSWRITPQGSAVLGVNQFTDTEGGDFAAGDTTLLDKITIMSRVNAAHGSGFQGTPDWVYETPESISVISREAIVNSPSRNTRDLFDPMAGVWANRSEGQNPGISVNIRGLQDQNRVVTMIDGARQNFQRNAHGSTQRTYVDSAFLRTVEVEKSGTSSVGGAGTLGGSVNFRTLLADDLIMPGRRWGAELNAATGTNEFDFDGSIAAAFRVSDRFSVLGGISHKDLGAYDIGENGTLDVGDGTYRNEGLLFSGSESWSGLLKAEVDFTDNAKLTLGWFHNQVDASQGIYQDSGTQIFKREDQQYIVNDTLTATFAWDPVSDLVDLKGQLWYSGTTNEEKRGARSFDNLGEFTTIDYEMGTFGGSLQNTSRFTLGLGDLSLNYGVEAFRDDGETTAPATADPETGSDLSYGYRGLNPSGRRDVISGFTNATLERDDWLTVSGGLRYDYFGLAGTTKIFGPVERHTEVIETAYEEFIPGQCYTYPDGTPIINPVTGEQVCEEGRWVTRTKYKTVTSVEQDSADVDIDLSGGALLPTAMVAVKPFDWLQPFIKYSQTYRPPTIMEAFASGGHPNGTNNEFAPNPWLEPEQGRTWEIGANVSYDGILRAGDRFRMKAVGFYREIEDYITIGQIYRSETDFEYNAYVNLDGITRMKGIELEANYDAGRFYLGGTFSYIDTDWAETYIYNDVPHNAEPGVIFVPPETQFTIDAGVRLLDERLTLGGRVTHADMGRPAYGILAAGYATEAYTVYDIYGSYAFNEKAKLRFAVNNVTDVAYVPALGDTSLPAPGRTATASLSFRF
ncbi:TonB-dependent receptor [Chelativorans sp. AA-79]|uniref:TonB-dependent receptor n=1 Tax=Chelativorans sp. AA-79 TaxID=3028735 RepID=UPI0023F7021B|nr:TonB-dependent receptor [Chelativorans sp. AA-79]WEX08518.1 TonB-dependent hemoglobin/transferrin/lactoferrin family receptor [Chelativorans sp. AA-79]